MISWICLFVSIYLLTLFIFWTSALQHIISLSFSFFLSFFLFSFILTVYQLLQCLYCTSYLLLSRNISVTSTSLSISSLPCNRCQFLIRYLSSWNYRVNRMLPFTQSFHLSCYVHLLYLLSVYSGNSRPEKQSWKIKNSDC